MNADVSEYHINVAGPVDDYIAPNMHCPHIGTVGNNYWQDRCDIRQTDPQLKKTCYPTCRINSTEKPIQQKTGTTEQYVPKTIQTGTLRAKIIMLTKVGESPTDIADKLNLTIGKVRDHLNKARRFKQL